ncbi:MAG: hypothetical protein E7456_06530 [Ruminococcaceae bacterium]|nr:hypothetical protein [Oscillospiraceae bacterium]
MKKWLCFILMIVLTLSLAACSNSENVDEIRSWDCTVTCVEESESDSYIITYSDKEIVSNTGMLTLQNRNDFAIVVHLLSPGNKEITFDIEAGGVCVFHQAENETVYTVGVHADVEEGTEINLVVYDGEASEPYVL